MKRLPYVMEGVGCRIQNRVPLFCEAVGWQVRGMKGWRVVAICSEEAQIYIYCKVLGLAVIRGWLGEQRDIDSNPQRSWGASGRLIELTAGCP